MSTDNMFNKHGRSDSWLCNDQLSWNKHWNVMYQYAIYQGPTGGAIVIDLCSY